MGRYCCKSRKSNNRKNLAKIDLWTGWFKEVQVKDIDNHSVRALLASRALLVKIKRDLENSRPSQKPRPGDRPFLES